MSNEGTCPKCGGTIIEHYHERSCLNCGATPRTPDESRKFYREHKAEMAKDLEELGTDAMNAKWGTPVQIISHLKSDPHKVIHHKSHPTQRSPALASDPVKIDNGRVFLTITDADLIDLDPMAMSYAFKLYEYIYTRRLKKRMGGTK